MAYPLGIFDTFLDRMERCVRDVKSLCTTTDAKLSTESVPTSYVLSLRLRCIASKKELGDVIAELGTKDAAFYTYVKNEKGVAVLDLASELTTLKTLLGDAAAACKQVIPVAGGFLKEATWVNGDRVETMFTTVEMAAVRTAMGAVAAAIA